VEYEEWHGMGCVEMRLRSTLFTVNFLVVEQPCIIMELKLPKNRKVARKLKVSWEMKTPQTIGTTTDRP